MAKKRIVLIDYLKAICVIFVILTHSDFLNDAMLDKEGLFYLLAVNKAVPVFMFLSGYVFAVSAGKKSMLTQYDGLGGRFLRLTVPTVVVFLIFSCLWIVSEKGITANEIMGRFIISDYGSGSYYYPIMVQFLLLAPCINTLIRKLDYKGVVLVGVMNFAYELLCTVTDINQPIYRIIVLRYLLVIAFGMYMAHTRRKKTKVLYVAFMGIIGLVYILLPYFTDYEYKLFTISPWNRSGMMSAFYVYALMYVVFKLFQKIQMKSKLSKAIAYVGQASYHIMYTQMLYFAVRPAFDKLVFNMTALPIYAQYIADIVVSISSGLVFCALDNKFFGKFYRSKAKKM